MSCGNKIVLNTHLYEQFVLKRYLELGVLLWNQLELLYSLRKEIGVGPLGPPFHKIFTIDPMKKKKIKM